MGGTGICTRQSRMPVDRSTAYTINDDIRSPRSKSEKENKRLLRLCPTQSPLYSVPESVGSDAMALTVLGNRQMMQLVRANAGTPSQKTTPRWRWNPKQLNTITQQISTAATIDSYNKSESGTGSCQC